MKTLRTQPTLLKKLDRFKFGKTKVQTHSVLDPTVIITTTVTNIFTPSVTH